MTIKCEKGRRYYEAHRAEIIERIRQQMKRTPALYSEAELIAYGVS